MTYPDIGFTREYHLLFAETAFGGLPAVFQAGGVEYRYYKREVWKTGWHDITSPYTYSGPVATNGAADWAEFYRAFHEHCMENAVVAEFARLHPWAGPSLMTDAYFERNIVYVDLTKPLTAGMTKGCRSACLKKLRVDVAGSVPETFAPLYRAAMERKGAGPGYLFDDAFFKRMNTLLPNILYLEGGGSAAIVLVHGDYATYFLAASEPGASASNALIYRGMQLAQKLGCKVFNLGGGVAAGDSLERFKRSFSKTDAQFQTYRKVHNRVAYEALCKVRSVDPNSAGCFPAYRR